MRDLIAFLTMGYWEGRFSKLVDRLVQEKPRWRMFVNLFCNCSIVELCLKEVVAKKTLAERLQLAKDVVAQSSQVCWIGTSLTSSAWAIVDLCRHNNIPTRIPSITRYRNQQQASFDISFSCTDIGASPLSDLTSTEVTCRPSTGALDCRWCFRAFYKRVSTRTRWL